MKQRLRNAVRISHFRQIEDKTTGGVAANKIMFHGLGLLCGAHLGHVARYVSIAPITSVLLRRGSPDAQERGEFNWRSSLNEVGANSVQDEIAERMKIELEHDSGAVTLNCSCADQQFPSSFPVGFAGNEKRDDLSFAGR